MSTQLRNPASLELLAARFELLSRVADDLAHEIKNPLHAMVINLEVLKRRVAAADPAAALGRAAVLEVELRRVNDLINQLLLLLRPPRADVQLLDVDQSVAEVVPIAEALARVAHRPFRYRPLDLELRAPIRIDAIAFALTALTSESIAASSPQTGIAITTEHRDGLVRIRVGPDATDDEHANGSTGVSVESAARGAFTVADAVLSEIGAHASIEPAQEGGAATFCVTLAPAEHA